MRRDQHLTSTIDLSTTAAPTANVVYTALAGKQDVSSNLTAIIAQEADLSVTGMANLYNQGVVMRTDQHLTTTIASSETAAAPTSATVHAALNNYALSSGVPGLINSINNSTT